MSVKVSISKIIGGFLLVPILAIFALFLALFYDDHIKCYFNRDKIYYLEEVQMYVRTERNVDRRWTRVSFGRTKADVERALDFAIIDRYNYDETYSTFIISKQSDSIFIILDCGQRALIECKSTQFDLVLLPTIVSFYSKTGGYKIQSPAFFNRQPPTYCMRFIEHPDEYCIFRYNWEDNDKLNLYSNFNDLKE